LRLAMLVRLWLGSRCSGSGQTAEKSMLMHCSTLSNGSNGFRSVS
jgi:hypothetical protein